MNSALKKYIQIVSILPYLFSFQSCALKIPKEKGDFREAELVELIRLDSSIHLDIRYANTNNFTGRAVYPEARAFLQKPAAEALLKAHQLLKTHGYGLLIFDGYRPWDITKLFWELTTSKEDKKFVANPREGSKHNRGCAVDLSLYDLKTGKEISMTGEYDEMSERSYPTYTGGTEEQKRMRDLLIQAMESNGFKVFQYEWWHFDYKDWPQYRIGNIPFSEIK